MTDLNLIGNGVSAIYNSGTDRVDVTIPGGGAACAIIAASNAPTFIKNRADDVCDGIADQTKINAALATSNAVILTWGEFLLSGPVLVKKDSARLVGMGWGEQASATAGTTGPGTRLRVVSGFSGSTPTGSSGTAGVVVDYVTTGGAEKSRTLSTAYVADFIVDGQNIGTLIDGVFFRSSNATIERVRTMRCTGTGVHFRGLASGENAGGAGIAADTNWGLYETSVIRNLASTNGVHGWWFDLLATDMQIYGGTSYSHDNGSGIHITDSSANQYAEIQVYNNKNNIYMGPAAGYRSKFIGMKIEGSQQHSIVFDVTDAAVGGTISQILFSGCDIQNRDNLAADNTYSLIKVLRTTGSSSVQKIIFSGGKIGGDTAPPSGRKPIYFVDSIGSATDWIFSGVDFMLSAINDTQAAFQTANSLSRLPGFNMGAMTMNHAGCTGLKLVGQGTASLGTGTSQAVTHGLDFKPNIEEINLGPQGDWGAVRFYVSAVTATTFTIAFTAAPTAHTMGWNARRGYR